MTGKKEHVTSKHVRGKDHTSKDTPVPEAEPVVGALAITEGTQYNGGGLHLHGGLFVAQLSERIGSNDSISPTPANPSTICHDDFFHVAGQIESHKSTPQSELSSHPTGSLRLLTETSRPTVQPSSHRTFGIYALSSSSSTISEMNTLLTRVAQHRDPSSSDRESWVNAVTRKLSDIGILSVPVFLSEIKTINARLGQVGHTKMNNNTLDIMAREAVNLRVNVVEATRGASASVPPRSDEMSP
jgi:hypothetical protein